MRRIVHVADGLEIGGAEVMLERLVGATAGSFEHRVISLTDTGAVGRRLVARGVDVQAVGLRPSPAHVPRAALLVPWLARAAPHVVQTWLYQADILGGLAARVRATPVVWGIHRVDLDPSRTKTRMRWSVRAGARLSSRVPTAIVCCSQSAAVEHARRGYDEDRMVVIPNGFDVKPRVDPDGRRRTRSALGVPDGSLLVGLVARWDPQKDHRTFAEAAGAVARHHPETTFVLCGPGVDEANATLRGWLAAAGVADRCLLLGSRDDVAAIQAALDVAVSSSAGEALPLAIGEAMAACVPCVVTDVGDSSELVGDTGRVVPPGDPAALATAIDELLALAPAERAALGAAARDRIARHYSLAAAADRYGEVWERAAGPGPA